MVHIVIVLSVILAAVCIEKENKRKYLYNTSFLILLLFSALRYNYGNDYFSYLKSFLVIKNGYSSPFKSEYVFTLLNKLSPNFYILIAVLSILFIFTLYKLITGSLDDRYVWMGLLILLINPYLFLMNLSAIRQCLATVLFIAAVPFAYKRRAVPFFALVVLAALCPKSAIILLPLFFIINDRQPKKGTLNIWTAAVMLLILSGGAVNKILAVFCNAFDDVNYYAYFANGRTNSLRSVLLSAIFYIYVIFNIRKLEGTDLAYAKLYLIGISLALVAFKASMLTRPEMYFDIFSVVTLPVMFKTNRELAAEQNLRLDANYPALQFLNCYVLPALMLTVYLLRYYSFFTNPTWQSFVTYHTILGAF